MMEHPGTETLHELLDGGLDARSEADLRAHLASCRACRTELEGLREAVEGLRSLPRSAVPPGHVWAGIRARLEPRPASAGEGDERSEARVVPLRTRMTRSLDGAPGSAGVGREPDADGAPASPRARLRRRFTLSGAQLAAAAALVAFLSAGTVWMALRPGSGGPATSGAVVEAPAPGGAAARAASMGEESYDEAVRELEVLVARGRGVLAPETLATLEESLATVDAALSDVRQALEEDPGSNLLRRMLAGHQTTKLRVLRQAATAIEARS